MPPPDIHRTKKRSDSDWESKPKQKCSENSGNSPTVPKMVLYPDIPCPQLQKAVDHNRGDKKAARSALDLITHLNIP